MKKTIPLRVVIGIKENGRHKYPSFNELPGSIRDNMDWSHFVDKFGGWHYDKQCGHADHDPINGTPVGQWCGMLLVPVDFADAAVAMFPGECSILSETDAEAFYNDRAHAHEQDIRDDTETLQAIASKQTLGISDPGDANALDPDHPARGRRRNKVKMWQGYKQQRGIELDDQRLRDVPRR